MFEINPWNIGDRYMLEKTNPVKGKEVLVFDNSKVKVYPHPFY
jgi:hypothetical protein